MLLDLIVRNARIRTGDPARPSASSVGVWMGRVVGLDEQLLGQRAAEEIDAKGAFLMAGFNDVHAHSVWFGQTLAEIDLAGLPTPESVYAALEAGRGEQAEAEWLVASNFDPLGLAGTLERDALDAAADGKPLLIKHASGHAYTLNGVGLRSVGVAEFPTERIDGGVIGVDADGRATGLLEENAMRVAQAVLMPEPIADLQAALARATARYAREGLTSVSDAGVGGGWIGHGPREFSAYQRAREAGQLKTRAQVMIAADVLHPVAGHASEPGVQTLDAGLRSGLGDEFLQLGPTKMFMDGSLLGKTAAMSENYCECSHSGYLQGDAEAMAAKAREAAAAGWALALHAIGDRGIDLALDIIEESLAAHGPAALPHRIEHGGYVRPEQVARLARLGVYLVPQPFFIPLFGDGMAAALGPERTAHSYPAASLLKAGLAVPGSSDRPVAPGAPLPIIQAFVQRLTRSGAEYAPAERLSVEQALDAYTLGSAAATGWAGTKGVLRAGALADFVVLAEDPREVAHEAIGAIDVLGTFVGGEATHTTLD
ncbi:amidohydrolase [Galactobacter valiniphilus]|uniref:Amidohydrolase n=1 Tax=Galactobacter valiniphilus TaxID=2676122 RepID=A0A399JAN8_9MICC|nr:amidohydrolase [Galactobacter valiniphilus]RII41269.1 amidohydrolase [Galactobacter valiniphilus]